MAEAEGIDADIRRVDNLTVATNPPQLERIKADYEDALGWSVPQERVSLIGQEETRARIDIRNVLGGFVHHGTARVQPAKLVRGLAAAVERLGVPIYEQTTVTGIEKGKVTTDRGTVRAPIIIRATEGFTAGIPGNERLWLPLNSAQIVTEPLPQELWDEIGWEGYELLGDAAHAYCYAQRTREGRITMGGRGVPYRYGSRTDVRGQTQQATIDKLHAILTRLLPQTRGLTHRPRLVRRARRAARLVHDVGLDRETGIGWAGGYVGLGVSSSNLSGRTLRDLILRPRHRTDPPALGQPPVSKWEPEPLRWLGVHSMYQLYRIADRARGSRPRGTRRDWPPSPTASPGIEAPATHQIENMPCPETAMIDFQTFAHLASIDLGEPEPKPTSIERRSARSVEDTCGPRRTGHWKSASGSARPAASPPRARPIPKPATSCRAGSRCMAPMAAAGKSAPAKCWCCQKAGRANGRSTNRRASFTSCTSRRREV